MTEQWFEKNSQYSIDDALGERKWPETLSLVRVDKQDDGTIRTSKGWGRESFGQNYARGNFAPKRVLREYTQDGFPFGVIMRSVPLLCVDIDGKNGGIQASSILRLPATLAERSKSGNGYHLFYRVPEATWDTEYGYDEFGDSNGIIPGVDIRATGIVYHYPQQRWNQLDPIPLPNSLRKLLTQKKEQQTLERERKAVPLEGEDLAIKQEQILERLMKPIGAGKRNQTLFALGCDMRLFEIKDWEAHLKTRGAMLGLDDGEMNSVVRNVKTYAL